MRENPLVCCRNRRSSRPRRLGERRYPWTIRGNPEYARICEEPGSMSGFPSCKKEIAVVAERVYWHPKFAARPSPCPSVLLHPNRGNERSSWLANDILGDTGNLEPPDFTQALKDPTFAGLHVGPRGGRAAAESLCLSRWPLFPEENTKRQVAECVIYTQHKKVLQY